MKTFFILGEVTNETLNVLRQIHEHKANVKKGEDRDIKVVICSEGGEENVGFAIYDTLKAYQKFGKVTTYGYGQVCSIASLIFQAGTQRELSKNCVFMLHNGSIEVDRAVDDKVLEEMVQFFKHNNVRYYANIAKRCGLTVDKVRQWCNDETYFTADEAIQAKLADSIVKDV